MVSVAPASESCMRAVVACMRLIHACCAGIGRGPRAPWQRLLFCEQWHSVLRSCHGIVITVTGMHLQMGKILRGQAKALAIG